MTAEFRNSYTSVPYFGLWAEESAPAYARRDALAVLADALQRCYEEDVRSREVDAALAFLARAATRQAAFRNFRRALDLPDPEARTCAATLAYEAIRRVVSP